MKPKTEKPLKLNTTFDEIMRRVAKVKPAKKQKRQNEKH